jgi:hypothetical protein
MGTHTCSTWSGHIGKPFFAQESSPDKLGIAQESQNQFALWQGKKLLYQQCCLTWAASIPRCTWKCDQHL